MLTPDNSRIALKHLGHYFTSIVFSPDGTTIASAMANISIWLWDTATTQHLYTLPRASDKFPYQETFTGI